MHPSQAAGRDGRPSKAQPEETGERRPTPYVARLALCWVVWVLGIWVVAFLVGRFVPPERSRPFPRSPVETLATWDGVHYAHIAAHGYSDDKVDRLLRAFFPLYPFLARLAGGKAHAPFAGILLSQLCALGAALLLQREELRSRRGAPLRMTSDPGFWLLATPCSFFLGVFYAESLFLLLSLLTAFAWRERNGVLAASSGFLAGLTRPTAITLPALALPSLLGRGTGKTPLRAVVPLAAPLAGLGLYLLYTGVTFRDPLAYSSIMKVWGHHLTVPFLPLARDVAEVLGLRIPGPMAAPAPLEEALLRVLSTLGVVALVVLAWRKIDAADRAYLLLSLLLIVSREPATAVPRHEVALYPVFLLLARADLGRARPPLAIAFVACQVLLLVRHASWLWVA